MYRTYTVRGTLLPAHFHFAEHFRDGRLQLLLGAADVRRAHAAAAMGQEPVQPTGADQDVLELGVDQVVDGLAERLRLRSVHGRISSFPRGKPSVSTSRPTSRPEPCTNKRPKPSAPSHACFTGEAFEETAPPHDGKRTATNQGRI